MKGEGDKSQIVVMLGGGGGCQVFMKFVKGRKKRYERGVLK